MTLLARINKLEAARKARAARMQRHMSPIARAVRWAAMVARFDPSAPPSPDQCRCARAVELYRLACERMDLASIA